MTEQWETLKDLPEAPAGTVGECKNGWWWFGDYNTTEQYMEKHPEWFRKVEAKPAPFEDVKIRTVDGELVSTIPEWAKSYSSELAENINTLPRFPAFVGYGFVSSKGQETVAGASRMYENDHGNMSAYWTEGRKTVLPSFARFRRGDK